MLQASQQLAQPAPPAQPAAAAPAPAARSSATDRALKRLKRSQGEPRDRPGTDDDLISSTLEVYFSEDTAMPPLESCPFEYFEESGKPGRAAKAEA
eukprot:4169754-Pyramimonas_sp.AAC.1